MLYYNYITLFNENNDTGDLKCFRYVDLLAQLMDI